MGSISDMPVMQEAIDILKGFDIETEVDIVSAHRTPEKLFDFSQNAHTRGISVVIAGAGGAAHLPGMVASMSPLPVIGVPIKSSNSIDGWDSVVGIRDYDKLPVNAKKYIEKIEEITSVKVGIVSTSPERDDTIIRG